MKTQAISLALTTLATVTTPAPAEKTSYRHLVTEVSIQASAADVWAVLMDFQSYPKWNSFIPSLKGDPKVGQVVEATLQPAGNKPMVIKPVVRIYEPEKHFAWKGKFLIRGIFDGEHHFELKAVSPTETILVQHEYFSGILVPFLKKMLKEDTRQGFEAMNAGLKAEAEARVKSRATAQL